MKEAEVQEGSDLCAGESSRFLPLLSLVLSHSITLFPLNFLLCGGVCESFFNVGVFFGLLGP